MASSSRLKGKVKLVPAPKVHKPSTAPLPSVPFNQITLVRFVQLVDGRKIMQTCRAGEYWETPITVDIRSLDEHEKAEITAALNRIPTMADPNYR